MSASALCESVCRAMPGSQSPFAYICVWLMSASYSFWVSVRAYADVSVRVLASEDCAASWLCIVVHTVTNRQNGNGLVAKPNGLMAPWFCYDC